MDSNHLLSSENENERKRLMPNTSTVNRDKLRNLFLMHQGDIETKIPEFAKELKMLLSINKSKRTNFPNQLRSKLGATSGGASINGIDKKFAKSLSKKFFDNFHKDEFNNKEEAIEQAYANYTKDQVERDLILQAQQTACMKKPTPSAQGLHGKQLHSAGKTDKKNKLHGTAERKHKLATLKSPLHDQEISIPNKYFCIDCGIQHFSKPRECEHCGEVHQHCCEVY